MHIHNNPRWRTATIYGTGQNISQDKIFHTPLTTFEEAVK